MCVGFYKKTGVYRRFFSSAAQKSYRNEAPNQRPGAV